LLSFVCEPKRFFSADFPAFETKEDSSEAAVSYPEFSWFSMRFGTKTIEENHSCKRSTDDEV
jgi:hypothetical protein